MSVLAHIGKFPVEEWAPFLVPVIALYFWARRSNRRRDKEIQRLGSASRGLTEDTTALVLDRWAHAHYTDVPVEYLPLLYPPGPEGMTADELAERTHADVAIMQRQLETLEDLGYLELQHRKGDPPRAWLTIKGVDLVYETEAAILAATV